MDEIRARTDTALDHFTQLEDQVGGLAASRPYAYWPCIACAAEGTVSRGW